MLCQRTILHSSSIPEGFGGADIYRLRLVGGHWQKPENLGPAIAVLTVHFAPAQNSAPFHGFLRQLLEIRPGMAVADVGAGRRDLAFLLADDVGSKGCVYANEISQDKVDQIEKPKRACGAATLTTILGSEEDPRLPEKVDYLVMV